MTIQRRTHNRATLHLELERSELDQRNCHQPGTNPDDWFAEPGTPESRHAKELCMNCPVYWECQAYARDKGIEYGIWGGMDRGDRIRYWKLHGGMPDTFHHESYDLIRPLIAQRIERESRVEHESRREGQRRRRRNMTPREVI